MVKHIRLLLPVIAVLFWGCEGFDLGFEQIRGSGKAATEQRSFSNIHAVSLAGVGDLRIEVGSQESIRIEADDNILPHIRTEVNNGKLTIGMERGFSAHPSVPIRYFLTVRELDDVGLSGSGTISTAPLKADSLEAGVSGSGEINLDAVTAKHFAAHISGSGGIKVSSGSVDAQEIHISGSGDYDGSDLRSGTTDVSVSGSGDSKVWATDILTTHVSGSGDVEYYGSPKLNKHVSGSGELISRGER